MKGNQFCMLVYILPFWCLLCLKVFWGSLCHLSYTEQYHLQITMLWLLPLLCHLLYLRLLSWCCSKTSNTILNRNGKGRHLCSLWYKAFMALTWVPPVPSFFGVFVGKGCYSSPKTFWHLLRCSCDFFLFIPESTYVVHCIYFVDCPRSIQICTLDWSWCDNDVFLTTLASIL